MPHPSHTWQEKLEIVDATMKAISGVSDPEELITLYYDGVGKLIPVNDYMSLSRRRCTKPEYVITRGSRMSEEINPFTHFELLPRRSGGLIADIMYGNKPVIINDLPARFKDDDPAAQFLTGYECLLAMPQYEDGEAINFTCMLLPAGDDFDYSLVPSLHWQASLFGRGVRNQVLRNQLSAALTLLDKELQTVGEIQRQLLPRELPKIAGFDVATHYLTSARAGGDYYDFFQLDGGQWGLFIADVSGHGTPAAVLMAITHALAHARPGDHTPPGTLLSFLNDQLTRTYTHGGTFVTAFYAVLDPAQRTLTYSRAGHNPPRLVRHDRVQPLDAIGALPMGIEEGQNFEETTIHLHSGDLLLLYTDGITEAMAPAAGVRHELFGVDRLDRLLLTCKTRTARETISCVKASIGSFTSGAPANDDQTLIAIRCL